MQKSICQLPMQSRMQIKTECFQFMLLCLTRAHVLVDGNIVFFRFSTAFHSIQSIISLSLFSVYNNTKTIISP
jgi:hypothetical protein